MVNSFDLFWINVKTQKQLSLSIGENTRPLASARTKQIRPFPFIEITLVFVYVCESVLPFVSSELEFICRWCCECVDVCVCVCTCERVHQL